MRDLRRIAVVAAGAMLLSGCFSLLLGQDRNFDQLNYHYYAGYALLHDRIDEDVAPAGIQTYLPPMLHVFHYLGMAHLPPRLFGFLLGAVHGLNVPLLLALGLSVLRTLPLSRAWTLSLVAAGLGALGPDAVSLLGTTFGDNLVSIPSLLALLLVLELDRVPARHLGHAMFAAGLLGGLATGLKLTVGVCQIALFVAAAISPFLARRRAAALAWMIGGGLLGFLLVGGPWAWGLYARFGNPVFPFANAWFRSDWYRQANFAHPVYGFRTASDLLRPVLEAAVGRYERLQEIPFRDLRLILLAAAGVAWLAVATWRTLRPQGRQGLEAREKALILYWLTGYVLWAVAFSYYRYFALLELMAPLVTLVLLQRVLPERSVVWAALTLAAVLVLTTRTASWGRRPWQSTWLKMPVPALGLQPDSMVMMVGMPISYVIPSFRDDARFVHLTAVDRFGAPEKWRARIARAVAGHRGPFLLMSNFEYSWSTAVARAAEFGLRATTSCEPIRRDSLRLRLCTLERTEAEEPARPAR